jgi:hypothetical protein
MQYRLEDVFFFLFKKYKDQNEYDPRTALFVYILFSNLNEKLKILPEVRGPRINALALIYLNLIPSTMKKGFGPFSQLLLLPYIS